MPPKLLDPFFILVFIALFGWALNPGKHQDSQLEVSGRNLCLGLLLL